MPNDRLIKSGNNLYLSPKNFDVLNRCFKLQATWYGRMWFKITQFFINRYKK